MIFERKLDRAAKYLDQLVNLEGDEGYVGLHLLSFLQFLKGQYNQAAKTVTRCILRVPASVKVNFKLQ